VPITFAPADPVSPGLSAAAGYAQEFAALYPTMARLAQGSGGGSTLAGAQAAAQQEQFNRSQQTQVAQQTQALQAQADVANVREQGQANAPFNQMAAQQQYDQWLQQQAWTSTDESQLAQAKAGMAQVLADPSLTPQEQQQAVQQNYQPYIQRAEQRKQFSDLRMETQRHQLQQIQLAHAQGQLAMQQKFMAGTAQQNMFTTPAGYEVLIDAEGKFHVNPPKKEADPDRAEAAKQAAEDRRLAAREKVQKDAYEQWHRVNEAAIRHTEEQVAATVETDRDKETGKTTKVPKYPWLQPGAEQDGVENYVHQLNANRALRGLDYHTPEEYVKKMLAEHDAATGRGPVAAPAQAPQQAPAPPDRTAAENRGRPPASGFAGQAPAAAAAAPAPPPERKPEPFSFGTPNDQLTDKQREIVKTFQASQAAAVKGLSPPEAAEYVKYANRMQQLIEQAGSVARMTPDQAKDYQAAEASALAVWRASRQRRSDEFESKNRPGYGP